LKRRDLSDRAAAKHIEGIDHSDISRIRNAELKRYTVDRLIRTLSQMNCRVDVSVKTIRKSQIAKSRTALA
ncbi:MAG: XRE family transcriptional regulator, partial [Gammaproteobacteria bacterium]